MWRHDPSHILHRRPRQALVLDTVLFQSSLVSTLVDFLFVAEENETLKAISRHFGSDAATLLDFNIATIAGLPPKQSCKGELQCGSAARSRAVRPKGDPERLQPSLTHKRVSAVAERHTPRRRIFRGGIPVAPPVPTRAQRTNLHAESGRGFVSVHTLAKLRLGVITTTPPHPTPSLSLSLSHLSPYAQRAGAPYAQRAPLPPFPLHRPHLLLRHAEEG
jgi:hypothetical protein